MSAVLDLGYMYPQRVREAWLGLQRACKILDNYFYAFNKQKLVTFAAVLAVIMEGTVLWNLQLCSLLEMYRCFAEYIASFLRVKR
jgi:hypothetical protein